MFTEFLLFFVSLSIIIYFSVKYKYEYWKRYKIPYISGYPIFGNVMEQVFFQKSAADVFKEIYNHDTAKNEPFVGIHLYHKPGLVLRNLDLIKQILLKDFNKFSNRYTSSDPHTDTVGANNLFVVKNPRWRKMRSSLSPIFSSGKMKNTFHLVNNIGSQLNSYLSSLPYKTGTMTIERDVKNIAALFTTDVIASVAFGMEVNSLSDENCEFRKYANKFGDFTYWRGFEFSCIFLLPQIVPFLRLKIFSKELSDYLRKIINTAMSDRQKSGIVRNDLIDALVTLENASHNENDKEAIKFEGDQLVAQAATFLTAGFETTSSAISFGLYELSKNLQVQKRLREEIRSSFEKTEGENMSYDVLADMEYLNMVVSEILRMYPNLPYIDRECTLSSGEAGYSLQPWNDFKIPNKMPIFVPVYAIQRDPQYWPEPDVFNPERFSKENRDNIEPYAFMPFGNGPHNCIGERLGIMQVKIGLTYFLRNHYVTPSVQSKAKIILESKSMLIQPETGKIFVNIVSDPDFQMEFL